MHVVLILYFPSTSRLRAFENTETITQGHSYYIFCSLVAIYHLIQDLSGFPVGNVQNLYDQTRMLCSVKIVISCTPIGTSEILPWVRKSYLTHAILPRLPREG